MSYCRFSSDDWRCDLYIYDDVSGGITTHVAGNKTRGYIPRTLPWPKYGWKEDRSHWRRLAYRLWFRCWWWSHRLQDAYIARAPRRNLNLPFDSESFNDPDGASCAARVRALVAAGYRVPKHVIAALETADEEATA